MRFGLNVTGPESLEIASEKRKNGKIDFVELLIDNFSHLPIDDIEACVGDCPIGLHIMWSAFTESTETVLASFARKLKEVIDHFHPIYVSDHIAQYSIDGRLLPHLGELDFRNSLDCVVEATLRWQDMLAVQLHLENYPSVTDKGDQIQFFSNLVERTGANILFDVSNAVIAFKNGGPALPNWLPIIQKCRHFHVGSFMEFSHEDDGSVFVDTHGSPVDELAIHSISEWAGLGVFGDGTTIVVERDRDLNDPQWESDLLRVVEAVDGY